MNMLWAELNNPAFMPHGHCYFWNPVILWANVLSDGAIALAYFAIPFFLLTFSRKRKDFQFNRIILMFASFIVACGFSHLIEIWMIWDPQYGIQSFEKLLTAAVSLATVWMLWKTFPIFLRLPSHNQLTTMIHKLEDEIDKRLQTEKSLRASEQKFHLMVEHVKDYAIFMISTEGRVETWNKGAEHIKGYQADEIIGKHFSQFFTPDDQGSGLPAKILAEAQKQGRCHTQGLRVRRDGSLFWADVVVTALHDADNQLMGFVKVTRDISEKKAAEEAILSLNRELESKVEERTQDLKKREAQLVAITNAVPYLIAEIDVNERLLFGNELFHRLVMKNSDSILGKQLREFLEVSRYAEIKDFLTEAKNGKPISLVRELHDNGMRMIFEVNYIPQFTSAQKVFAIILVASDITKHVLMEEDLKQAKEFADAANLAKSAFLANMSHEIRTPLGAVVGFADLIIRDDPKSEDKEYFISAIRRNSKFLLQIINDILDLSKIEAGKVNIRIRDVSMDEIFHDLNTLLKLQAEEKNLQLIIDHDANLPKVIQTDPLRIKQILLNIVGNAIKFTQHGWVRVSISVATKDSGEKRLNFVVQDTGIGISKEDALKLFTPFTQADASYTRKFGGSGLGLVLAKHLANLLGGDVALADSKPGKGSVFTISVDPGTVSQEKFGSKSSAEWGRDDEIKMSPSSPSEVHRLNEIQILIVDDAPDNVALASYYLANAGVRVESAQNGVEALEKVEKKNYSLLFMDLQMPIMDGFEATAVLRQRGYEFPIIALTAHAFEETRKKCMESGFTDFLSKPIDSQKMLDCLNSYAMHPGLGHSGSESSPSQ